jgi:hypothetical protein
MLWNVAMITCRSLPGEGGVVSRHGLRFAEDVRGKGRMSSLLSESVRMPVDVYEERLNAVSLLVLLLLLFEAERTGGVRAARQAPSIRP